MRNLFYLLVALCFMNCNKENQEGHPGAKGVSLILINENGENLLNPEIGNSIAIGEIQNLYLIGEEYIAQYHGTLDHPKLCGIFDSEAEIGNCFEITLSEHFNEEGLSTTIIDWGNGDLDTIVATMNPHTKLPYTQFWYNEISMENITTKTFREDNDDYYYEIQK